MQDVKTPSEPTIVARALYWRRRLNSTLRPERAILWIGAIAGLIFLFAIPPFQAPDEPQYFFHAFHLSELRLFDIVSLNKEERARSGYTLYGAFLPSSLARLVDSTDLTRVRFKPDSKIDPSKILNALRIPLQTSEREYLPIAPYPLLSYVPQALGIAVGRFVGLPPLGLLYMGRFGGLVSWVLMMYASIRITPILKWTYFLLAMMPMTLHLAASNSGDSVAIGLAFLTSATLLYWAYDPEKKHVRWGDVAYLGVLVLGIVLSKIGYVGLLLFFALVSPLKFRNRSQYFLAFVALVVLAVASATLWSRAVHRAATPGPSIDMARFGVDPPEGSNVSPAKQLEFMRTHPLFTLEVVGNTVWGFLGSFIVSFSARLGWLDTLLPLWLPLIYLIALLVVALDSPARDRVTTAHRIVSGSIFCLTSLFAFLYFYAVNNPVGWNLVYGVQGRYLIPIAPAFFLLFQLNGDRTAPAEAPGSACVAFAVVTTAVAIHSVVHRFYLFGS